MHATLRQYEGVGRERSDELSEEVTDALMPCLSELPGFSAYHLVEAGDGVMTSISLFEISAQADESTRVASALIREQELDAAPPHAPKVTSGPVIAHKTDGLVAAV